MTVRETAWPEGTPCWVDLAVDDVDRAVAFYSALFGWDIPEGEPETGGYRICLSNGHPAAGLGPKPPGMEMPSVWTTYLASDDIEATLHKIEQAGGTVMMPTMDIMDLGRMTVAADPTGAVFGMWQAQAFAGAAVVNEPNALIWTEQMSHDHQAAAAFYAAVFGHELTDVSGEGFSYLMIGRPGVPPTEDTTIGGIGAMSPDSPAPPHWLAYIAVADTDASAKAAAEGGGSVLSQPQNSPYGRNAVLSGPEGETFAIISSG